MLGHPFHRPARRIGFVFSRPFTGLIRYNSFPKKHLPFLLAPVQLALFGATALFVVTPPDVPWHGHLAHEWVPKRDL
jgi:hypothetical protein